ncbi:DUF6614 family protein [Dongia sp. agr-C8]
MVTMHGVFDLKPGIEAGEYRAAFEAFCQHLRGQGYVTGWSFMRRSPHAGYDRRPPGAAYHVGIDFPDRSRAEACYRYVAANDEPLRSLHVAMNTKVVAATTQFFLLEAVPAGDGRPTGNM